MKFYRWTSPLKSLHEKAVQLYRAGNRDANAYFSPEEVQFLTSIGAKASELYDYAEDADSLDWETALLIVAARRDYFFHIQGGKLSTRQLGMNEFPAKDAELDGIPWLPRLILKAQARLKGEMPADLMYCCGGDRHFFQKHDIHPADFLRIVWAAKGDDSKVLDYARGNRSGFSHIE